MAGQTHMVINYNRTASEPEPDPTLEAIDAAILSGRPSWPRKSIGFSEIGGNCSRKIWYNFNNYPSLPLPAYVIKCAMNGDNDETVMATRLRMVPGLELHTHDPSTAKQYRFADLSEKFVGRPDGFVRGLLHDPGTWHLWEHKAKDEKYYKPLVKLKIKDESKALQAWNPEYYAQAVLLMHHAELTDHYMTVGTPGLRHTVSIRTKANPEYAEGLKAKAKRLIGFTKPPARMSNDPAYFECAWCQFREICHGAV